MVISQSIIFFPRYVVTIVSLDGTDEFKGFLLQARDSSGNAIGSFTIPSGSFSKTLDCSGGSNVRIFNQLTLLNRLEFNSVCTILPVGCHT